MDISQANAAPLHGLTIPILIEVMQHKEKAKIV